MLRNEDFSAAPSSAIVAELGRRLEQIRLGLNQRQEILAQEAGVSRSTVHRIEGGNNISLDSFVRLLIGLGMADQLAALLPDMQIRPVEMAERDGNMRQRATGGLKVKSGSAALKAGKVKPTGKGGVTRRKRWGDEEDGR